MRILLIISGSIAAYKSLELIRLLRKRGDEVEAVLTAGGAQFITPLAVSSLTGRPTYTDLFSLKEEVEMGHIRLSREADIVLVAPASADLIARLATGQAADLASAVLLASDKRPFVAPAMNSRMWDHPATQRNLAHVAADGARLIAPATGGLACGETGPGRMAEPEEIIAALDAAGSVVPIISPPSEASLAGRHFIVTAGPTIEPIDPVRFIGNRSSGKQGYAIAAALSRQGAKVTLVSGPVALEAPSGVTRVAVETARQMEKAVIAALPADGFIATAAVADWRPAEPSPRKMKKRENAAPPALCLKENPDILAEISHHAGRPRLVVGFALETENLLANAEAKRLRKGCDWILANPADEGGIFGAERTAIHLLSRQGQEDWGTLSKNDVAGRLVERIAGHFAGPASSIKPKEVHA